MLKHAKSTARRGSNEKGFTLVELLVVIVILGILAAVVVFAIGNIRATSEKNACKTEGRTVRSAVEAYRADTGNPPADASVLTGANGYLDKTPQYWTVSAGVVSRTSGGPSAADCPA